MSALWRVPRDAWWSQHDMNSAGQHSHTMLSFGDELRCFHADTVEKLDGRDRRWFSPSYGASRQGNWLIIMHFRFFHFPWLAIDTGASSSRATRTGVVKTGLAVEFAGPNLPGSPPFVPVATPKDIYLGKLLGSIIF